MTNKETIERNIGLTFDFVNHLIDNETDLEQLPEHFVVEFVEKDFSNSQKKHSLRHTIPSMKRKYQVKNSFVIA